ncbi:flagellar biosynthesis protein FlhB [Novosphingobium marinum]|uniref:Flagellar biosynthetic protein FlhB n=1 Tax=Novosphingobium marinum TaxID=1514948 RepID=A0A7Y9XX26_9SPHN|nr:EscU/YscU/HrcU family type III secretion system export apparatus switch protein [Novosphingobium marinum]NYH94980.1 flagellar biosynthetic protein FlhB [Novosphingobium marinum]GGC41088.1 flagellar biosynthesis protein FlhB [Novosphingobium marinum]
MKEENGEKSFAPSAKRKADAAKKGDVLRSRELATAAAVLVGATWLQFAGPWVLGAFEDTLRSGFAWDREAIADFAPGRMMRLALVAALPPVFVLGAAVLALSLASQLGFGEGRWVAKNLQPKPSRLNPLNGLKRMFGPNGAIEMGKGLAKVALLGAIAWGWGQSRIEPILGLGRGNLPAQLAFAWDALVSLLFALCAGLAIIALVDTPIQWLRRQKRLKMSHQDLRDEQKETDGAPEKKAAQRDRQRQIAKGGIAGAMREAQFVITNPTHFAVALAYDPAKAPAPIVLARGRGEKALAMRELAAELELPSLEYPALARSVYYTTRERQVIREELYAAVASILAFVMSLKRGEHLPAPDVEVPLMLRFDTEGRLDPSHTP